MTQQTAIDTTPDIDEALQANPLLDSEEAVQTIKKKTISGAASYMIRTVFLQAISIATVGILAAYLSASDVGVYTLALQVIGLLTFFSDIGFGSALIQKKREPTLAEYRSVFTVQQVLSCLIFFVTLMLYLSGVLEPKIGQAGGLVLVALGISFPLVTLKTISSVMLERKLEFGKLVLPQIVEQLLYNGVLIYMAINGYGVMSYFYAVLIRTITGVMVMFYLQPWSLGLAWDQSALKEMMGMGVKFQLNDLIARVKDQLFYLALGLYLPSTEFGYIGMAKLYSQLPYQLTVQNVVAITFPTYARLQHDQKLLKRAIEKTLYFISLLIFPLLVGMSLFIFPLVELVPKYAKWQPALLTFVLFTLSIGWGAISTPLTNTLNAIGHINTTLKLMVMWTVLTWVVIPLAVWWLGFIGVGVGTLIIAFSSVMPIYYVKKIIDVDVWGQVWQPLAAALVMAGVGVVNLSWAGQSWLGFVGAGAVTGLAYGAAVLAFGHQKLWHEVRSLRK